MWDLSSLIWVRSLPPSPEVSGKRTFFVKYYTMILQCPTGSLLWITSDSNPGAFPQTYGALHR